MVDAFVAVVDRMPSRKRAFTGAMIDTDGSPFTDPGAQGISYALDFLAHSIEGISDPDSSNASVAAKGQHHSLPPGTIRFTTRSDADHRHFREVVDLKAANTVFTTGREHTMLGTRWQWSAQDRCLKLQKQVNVESQHIAWPMLLGRSSGEFITAVYEIPLIPLTPARYIESSMGNILRLLHGPEGKTFPASIELESAIEAFFRVRSEQQRTVQIWAIVGADSEESRRPTPISPLQLKSLWKMTVSPRHSLAGELLGKGARLYKVLSGGGGWGKKAGLLSLDPEAAPQRIQSSIADAALLRHDGIDTIPESIQDIAPSGYWVQFFVSAEELKESNKAEVRLDHNGGRELVMELGVVPDSSDEIHTPNPTNRAVHNRMFTVYSSYFGALSEKGISVKKTKHGAANSSNAPALDTYLDVPYTRLRFGPNLELKRAASSYDGMLFDREGEPEIFS